MNGDERPAGAQGLVEQAFRQGAEISAAVPDRALASKIAQQVAEAFVEGARRAEAERAAAADLPEPVPAGVTSVEVATNIRMIGPGDERARALRWTE